MTSIETLVADLTPVRPVNAKSAAWLVLGALGVAILVVWLVFGLRSDILAGAPQPIVLLRSGTLLLLGFGAFAALTSAARPGVGHTSHGWKWALAAAALFPMTSLIVSVLNREVPAEEIHSATGPWCLSISSGSALLIGGTLTLWLKRGAPTSIYRASWLVGLAAGSLGAFAYNLHCPSGSVHYVGIWYSAAVALCAGLGRLIVPQFIRW